jgi:Pentapeptide repeats (8 copies)
MLVRERRSRPDAWSTRRLSAKHVWMLPFTALEWIWEWIAFALGNWAFLEVLERLGSFSILVAVIFYFADAGNRVKQRHYQAWQVINTAQGKGGSGGRIEALQELNTDKVPLVGVDVSSAFLQGLQLKNANLLRSNFSAADLRNSNLTGCNFTLADLNSANLRGAELDHANFSQADLRNSDLMGSSLAGADLSGAALDESDLRSADLRDVQWQHLGSVKRANVAGARNAPAGFIEWALKNGAVNDPNAED